MSTPPIIHNFAGQSVSIIPVFFVVQRPGQFDADGVILSALGQVVSGNKKDNTHEKTAPVDEVKQGVQRIL